MITGLDITAKKRNTRGFTLVEVMLGLALSAVTIASIYSLYLSIMKTQAIRGQILDMQQQARAAMDLITRELNMAGFDPHGVNRDESKANDFWGVTFDLSELKIKADLNGNGVPIDANESIVFSHDPDTVTIRRNTGGGRQPLGEYIEDFSFRFFDSEGDSTAQSERIRQIEVSITARTEKPDPQYFQNGGYRTITLKSRVTPRNLSL